MHINRSLGGWAAIAMLLLLWSPSFAQTGPIQYGYDRLGRLITVVDGDSNAAIYNYDAVGNLLSIQRIDAPPDPVAITVLVPNQGKVGTTVSILGKGFGATAAQNLVSFGGGATASVTSASSTGLRVIVPVGAVTGPISVTAPAGSATSSVSFRVVGPLTVTPVNAYILPGTTQQFSVSTTTGGPPPVEWAVNGVVGGNATIGMISTAGLYAAPSSYVQQPMSLTITAKDQGDPSIIGSTTATLGVLGTLRFAAAREVSVTMPGPVLSVNNVQTSVSAVIGGHPQETVHVAVSAVVGGHPQAMVASQPMATAFAPFITAVSPTSGTHGTTLSVTITGLGFTTATGVTTLRNNTPDSTITASLVSINGDGTQATVQLVLASGAPTGVRVIQITTSTNTSTALGLTGLNLFTVQ